MISACSIEETVAKILGNYTTARKDDLIPILRETQSVIGYLPNEAIRTISDFLNLAPSRVFGVATFYADFRLAPEAKKIVRVCQGPACHLAGSKKILQGIETQLGIQAGQTTGDRVYGLGTTTCSGACAQAPVVEVNEENYGHITIDKVKQILSDAK